MARTRAAAALALTASLTFAGAGRTAALNRGYPSYDPPEPKEFIVPFKARQATPTIGGRTTLSEAARYAIDGQATCVLVIARADAHAGQLGLAERRAHAAALELIRTGVPSAIVDVSWQGRVTKRASDLLGAHEPGNGTALVIVNC